MDKEAKQQLASVVLTVLHRIEEEDLDLCDLILKAEQAVRRYKFALDSKDIDSESDITE